MAMAKKRPTGSIGASSNKPIVGIIMGSGSDWDTMKFASKTLAELHVPHETRVVSAHRTPDLLFEYAGTAEKRGIEVIIAGAGGAAHLPGMAASKTILPVLGVPVESKALKGLDSLLSIAQMPSGIPVGALAIGRSGAVNAALRDKAVDEVAGLLFPRAEEVIFTAPRTSRAISAAQLAEIAGHHAPHSSIIPDAEKALDYALAKAAPEDAVFITGSLYLIGQLRHYWKHRAQVATR